MQQKKYTDRLNYLDFNFFHFPSGIKVFEDD